MDRAGTGGERSGAFVEQSGKRRQLAKRIGSLNDAVKMARLMAKFVQQDDVAGWVERRDAAFAKEFRQKVERACIQGCVEREIATVKGIIRTYRSLSFRCGSDCCGASSST